MKKIFLLLLVLGLASCSWAVYVPPIGIPAPSFGINETYRMYDDDPGVRNGALTYRASDGGGFYTHYIDMDDVSATDGEGNDYGTITTPRLTMPVTGNVPEGSIVEVHGGVYTTEREYTTDAIKAKPIFIRGDGIGDNPVIAFDFALRGNYYIVENIDFNGKAILIERIGWGDADYVCVRNSNMTGGPGGPTGMIFIAGKDAEEITSNIVIYNVHINGGRWAPPDEELLPGHGVGMAEWTDSIWILNCEIHNLGSDGVGNADGSNYTDTNWYIGGNTIYNCQNAVDCKEIERVVVSQNIFHSFSAGSGGSSLGVAIVLHWGSGGAKDSPKNNWILFNEIYNCDLHGIQLGGGMTHDAWIIGNVIHDIQSDILKNYRFDGYDDQANIISRLVAFGYIDGDGVVDPGFTALSQAFKDEFDGGYDQFTYIEDLVIYCRDAGEIGWGMSFRVSEKKYVLHNTIYNCDNGVRNASLDAGTPGNELILISNIISEMVSDGFHVLLDGDAEGVAKCEIHHNIFHQSAGDTRFDHNGSIYTLTELVANTDFGDDSSEADPLFTDAANNDFTLQIGSPAIDTGIGHAEYGVFLEQFGVMITYDINGISRPKNGTWDIGANEYGSGPYLIARIMKGIK